MNDSVNTVIIGGGPAGVACGLALLRRGVSNLIIEKKSYPREKVCGGLISYKTYERLCELRQEEPPPELFRARCTEVELRAAGKKLARTRIGKPFYLVRRAAFDSALADWYRQAGGRLLENRTCLSLDPARGELRLDNGDLIAFDRLVAADGALSKTRAMLGLPKPALGFCLETFLPREPARNDPLTIDFGFVKNGYAWLFPAGEELCVGLGGAWDRKTDYKAALRALLAANGISAPESAFRGAFVPYGECVDQKKGAPNAVLIGDAGGFVDPIYGEGLYFALSTGIAAANAAAQNAVPFKEAFLKETAPFAEIIRQGNALQKKFFSPPLIKAFCKRIRGKDAFLAYYCDHQLARYDYPYSRIWKIALDYKKTR